MLLDTAVKDFGNAEVDQADFAEVIHHNVGGLHIAENNRLGLVAVQIVKDIAQVNGPFDNFLHRQFFSLVQQRFEVAAVYVLHHQIHAVILVKEVENLGYSRVAQCSQNIRFPLKCSQC